ncbi:fatty acyl-CoA reductase wat-like [Melitaea cinxia]|uniref:fatty acyl-CoA reductase wat-like n=1 Tax=Melitaea cinxia TaxID=113334 RepID=UPI001E274129|nr:fatty acyl-CoA reductase wat-like [Melitaea cinxia]
MKTRYDRRSKTSGFKEGSLVHLSTAYSHATISRVGKEVEEDFYESPISPDILIELAETMDNEVLTAMITPLMKDWPNTYTLTKAVAEELIRVQGRGLPICIVRPAGVVASYREPCPGWVDVRNVFGPSGLVLGVGLGALHTLLVKNSVNVDFVPVDIVNNIIIVAAYETQNKYASGKRQINIYAATKSRTPAPFGVFNAALSNEARNIVTSKTIWYCFGITTPYKFIYRILTWILHYIPAVMVDGICRLFGQKPRLLPVYKKVSSLSSVLEYFLKNDWVFQDTNTLSMYNSLSQTDKLIYNCDLASVNARELYYIWAYGVVRFIIKDDFKLRKYAQRKQTVLKYVHYLILPLYLYALLKIALMVVKIILHVTKIDSYIF